MTKQLDTKRLAETMVSGAKQYIDRALGDFQNRLKNAEAAARRAEDRVLVLETIITAETVKVGKPVVRVPARTGGK